MLNVEFTHNQKAMESPCLFSLIVSEVLQDVRDPIMIVSLLLARVRRQTGSLALGSCFLVSFIL